MKKQRQNPPAIKRTLIAASILAIPFGAMAQTTDSTAPAVAKADGAPPENVVVVTAFKRSSTLLQTPAAISVLSGDNLREQGINDLTNIQDVVPGVVITNSRDGVQVAMRGVQATDTSSKGEQDIAFNVDGTNIGRGNARTGAMFDIDRIEVLRGPQGTLYGHSSTGGAINVITNKPVLGQTSGYVKAEYGNFDAQRVESALNIPLGDMFAFRAAGVSNTRDGFSKPIGFSTSFQGQTYNFPAESGYTKNDQRDRAGRFSLLFQPAADTSLRLTQTVGYQGGVGSGQALETQMQAHDDTGAAATNALANPVPAFLDSHSSDTQAQFDTKLGGVQLQVLGSHQILNFRQQLTTGQSPYANGEYRISPYFQPDPTLTFGPALFFSLSHNLVKTDQFEAHIANADTSLIDYVAGVNWYREAAGEDGQNWAALLSNPLDTSTYLAQSGPINVTTHRSAAVFGQATWHLTDQLGLVGGLRYTHSSVIRVGTFALPFNFNAGFPPPPYGDVRGDALCTYPYDCAGDASNGSEADNKVTWKAGLNYQMSRDHLLYASVATGFKAGGFNDYDPATKGPGNYAASQLTAYEIGYKGRLSPAFTLSSSLYYYDFSKDQITSAVEFPGGTTAIYTQTVPTKIYGWENEASYRLARETSLTGSVELLHTKFVNYQAGINAYLGDPINFSGQEMDSSPKVSATLALNHALVLPNSARLRLRLSTKYSSSYLLSDLGNGVRYRQPSFTRSDASVAYEPAQSSVKVELFVTNIENKIQRTGALLGYQGNPYGGTGSTTFTSIPPNELAFNTSDPRLFGVRISTDF
jgi:iron complex outermembrane receptor protein